MILRLAAILCSIASLNAGCKLLSRHSGERTEEPRQQSATPGDSTKEVDGPPPTGQDPGFALVGPPLQGVGPIHPMHGFPMWYADATGTKLELCLDADPRCVIPPADYDQTKPLVFPENFPGESFYWMAESRLPLSTGGQMRVLFAIEAAFMSGVPIPGERITFARTLFVAAGVRDGIYRITHPYGVNDVEVVGGRVRNVSDIGVAKEQFSGLLNGPFGTLLKWDAGAPTGYFGDAAVTHTFTGSPLGTNFFRVDYAQNGTLVTVATAQVANIAGRLAQDIVVTSLSPDTFTTAPTLTLAAADPAARIFYTLDGSDPTVSSSRSPAAADAAPGNLMIKPTQSAGTINLITAFQRADGTYGKVSSYLYNLDPNLPSVQTTPAPGVYTNATSVTLKAEGPVNEIRYTLDHTDPMVSSTAAVYSGQPIPVVNNGTTLIRIVGVNRSSTGSVIAKSAERKAYFTIKTEKLTRSVINPAIELPFWVKDSNGISLAPCVSIIDPMCLPVAIGVPGGIDPNVPVVFPRNFSGESFVWNATSVVNGTPAGRATLVLGVEGAFPTPVATQGERVIFGRIRIRVDLNAAGHYRVTHPYGVEHFDVPASALGVNAINWTEDIDPLHANFDAFRFGRVGPFLRWDSGAPVGYIGDPNVPHTVVGSPFGTNIFRVERLVGNTYQPFLESNQFTVSGKLSPVIEASASPMGAFYTAPQQITLTASDPTATIYYTLDGTNPIVSKQKYTAPITVTNNTSITYVAMLPTGEASAPKTDSYTIDTAPLVINATPVGGSFADRVTVTLAASRAGKIYYTTNATSPLDALYRQLYVGPITLNGPAPINLQSVAIDQTGMTSNLRSDTYAFSMTAPTVTPPVSLLVANAQISAGNVATNTSWTAQTFGGRSISSFALASSVNGGPFNNVNLTPPQASSLRSFLAPGNNYEYRVSATDSGGLPSTLVRGGAFSLSALQEAAGAITYRGTWLRTVAANFYGGAARSTTTRNASATIRFTGTQVAWITAIGPTMGVATVSIDGVNLGIVDLYAPQNLSSVMKFVRTGLTRAVHTMVINATGTRNQASTGTRVDVDAIAVIN